MPALEMEMLCCSMASWMLVLSWSFICAEGQGALDAPAVTQTRPRAPHPGAARTQLRTPGPHLVKFINEAHSSVSQHQGASLQGPLPADRVALDIRGEAHGRGALAGGEDGPAGHLLHVLEELRLGRAGVPAQQHVDVTPHLVLAACGGDGGSGRPPAHHRRRHGLLPQEAGRPGRLSPLSTEPREAGAQGWGAGAKMLFDMNPEAVHELSRQDSWTQRVWPRTRPLGRSSPCWVRPQGARPDSPSQAGVTRWSHRAVLRVSPRVVHVHGHTGLPPHASPPTRDP